MFAKRKWLYILLSVTTVMAIMVTSSRVSFAKGKGKTSDSDMNMGEMYVIPIYTNEKTTISGITDAGKEYVFLCNAFKIEKGQTFYVTNKASGSFDVSIVRKSDNKKYEVGTISKKGKQASFEVPESGTYYLSIEATSGKSANFTVECYFK